MTGARDGDAIAEPLLASSPGRRIIVSRRSGSRGRIRSVNRCVADTGYVLQTGRVVLHGPAGDLIGDPLVQEAFLAIGAA